VLKLLGETPRRIAAVTKALSKDQLRRQPAPGSWSINEVLAHLRACADVWGRCIETILTEESSTIRHVSPRSYIRKTNYTDQDFALSFQAFDVQRRDLLKKLRRLTPEHWLRSATVKTSAKPRIETILSYAQRLAQHEAQHCEQVHRISDALIPS
jgi:uncharacterized damage-inducible protein DinB